MNRLARNILPLVFDACQVPTHLIVRARRHSLRKIIRIQAVNSQRDSQLNQRGYSIALGEPSEALAKEGRQSARKLTEGCTRVARIAGSKQAPVVTVATSSTTPA